MLVIVIYHVGNQNILFISWFMLFMKKHMSTTETNSSALKVPISFVTFRQIVLGVNENVMYPRSSPGADKLRSMFVMQ